MGGARCSASSQQVGQFAQAEEGHRRRVCDRRHSRSGACRARRTARSRSWTSANDADADLAALLARGDARLPRALRGAQAESRSARLSRSADQGARPRVRQRRGVRANSASGSACCWSTNSRTPIRCRRNCCCCLAGDDGGGLRPGALFIVGDPKQSIYRFRRADVGAYRAHRDDLDTSGATPVTLQTSFRSVPAIQRFVNAAFSRRHDRRRQTRCRRTTCRCSTHRPRAPPSNRRSWRCRSRVRTGEACMARRRSRRRRSMQAQPPAIGAFVAGCCRPTARGRSPTGDRRRNIAPATSACCSVASLHFGGDMTRDYVEALEARGVAAPARRRQDLPRARRSGRDSHRADRDRMARGRAVGLRHACTVRCSRSAKRNCSNITRSPRAFHPYRVPRRTARSARSRSARR